MITKEYILTKDYHDKCLLKVSNTNTFIKMNIKAGAILHSENNIIFTKKNIPLFYENSEKAKEYTKLKEGET